MAPSSPVSEPSPPRRRTGSGGASEGTPSSAAQRARFSDRPIFRSSGSTRRIFTSISWPNLTTSSGLSTL